MTSAAPAVPARLLFVDWLRGWAIVVMVEVHVFNSLLRPELRDTAWFHVLNFVNGMVAPSFLFVSGFVFLVSSERRLEDLRALRPPFWRQLRRIGFLWLIAYALHLPPAPLSRYFSGFGQLDWPVLYQVDVLHSICATWLFLLVSLVLIRSERLGRLWLLAWTIAATALAPWAWSIDFTPPLAAPLAAYLNGREHSLFPLFPWSGFMLAGALCASMYLAASRGGNGDRLVWRLTGAGIVCIALGCLLPPLSWLPGGDSATWAADPRKFVLRLGIVLVLLGACRLDERWRPGHRSSLFLTMSRESLFVYVGHILLLFAPLWNGRSSAQAFGQTHGPFACAWASLALIAVMALLSRLWARRKPRQRA